MDLYKLYGLIFIIKTRSTGLLSKGKDEMQGPYNGIVLVNDSAIYIETHIENNIKGSSATQADIYCIKIFVYI